MRTISSRIIYFPRLIPVIGVAMALGASASALSSPTNPILSGEIVLPLAMWAIVAATVLAADQFKHVALRDRTLLISGYWKTIEAPVTGIKKVTEDRFSRQRSVTIWFREPTEAGASVTFVPKTLLAPFAPHPIVAELEELAGLKPPPPATALR